MDNLFQYKPFKYFTLTFAATYLLWSIGAVISFQDGMGGLSMAFMLPGLMAPFKISLFMMAASKPPGMLPNSSGAFFRSGAFD